MGYKDCFTQVEPMAFRLVHSAKLAETCPPFAKVSARRQMALADWAEDTRCASSTASQQCILT